MPKIDLALAQQIKGAMGEVLQLKGPGFSWTKPSPRASSLVIDAFAALSAPWAYYLADDQRAGAGAWTWRLNPIAVGAGIAPRTLTKYGAPQVTVDDYTCGGLTTVGSWSLPGGGCWWAQAPAPFPAAQEFAIWALNAAPPVDAQGAPTTAPQYDLYLGPLTNSTVAQRVVAKVQPTLIQLAGSRGYRNFTVAPSVGVQSVLLTNPSCSTGAVAARKNNVALTVAAMKSRDFTSDGPLIVVGGQPPFLSTFDPAAPNLSSGLTRLAVLAFCFVGTPPEADLARLAQLRSDLEARRNA